MRSNVSFPVRIMLGAACLAALLNVPTAFAQKPATPAAPTGLDKAAVEARWDKYRDVREELSSFRISPEEAATKLTKLAEDFRGSDLEPFLMFQIASIRYRQDRFDDCEKVALQVKSQWPEHYLVKETLQAFGNKSQVDSLLDDIQTQRASRKEVPIQIPTIEPDPSPRVVLKTTEGPIVIAFYSKIAPKHVENFLKRVEAGEYKDKDVFLIHPGLRVFMGDAVGATPSPNDPAIASEVNILSHVRGAVAMNFLDPVHGDHARQFSICFGYPTYLDLDSTVFGTVVEGMEIVDAIGRAALDPQTFAPAKPVKIIDAMIR